MAKGPLFPELPEDLTTLGDEELKQLRDEHETAIKLIQEDNEDFLKGLDANEIIEQLKLGVAQMQSLDARVTERAQEYENFQAEKEKLLSELKPEETVAEETLEVVAEAEEPEPEEPSDPEGEEKTEEVAEDRELVLASAETEEVAPPPVRYSRRPPAVTAERTAEPTVVKEQGTALVASGSYRAEFKDSLDADSLARLVVDASVDLGPLPHDGKGVHIQRVQTGDVQVFGDRRVQTGQEVDLVWDGPKTKIARAEFEFPPERTLNGHDDYEKIRAVLPETVQFMGKPGGHGGEALVASGGLCAPLTPIYTMPNFATEAEPVWDSLPVFRAARGGVNVPAATYIADITTAISSISEANDALGGTFATKSCQALVCPDYTETAVQILAHCREYGNLNARAWPEKIAHENALTMAALSRTSETFMLDRIKALSINVTQAAIGTQYGSFASLVHAIVKASAGIKFRLRMPRTSNFRVLLPSWIPDHLAADNAAEAFDRYMAQDELERRLSAYRITVAYYLDDVTGGTSQGFAAEAAGALDEFPDDVQYAIYPEGQFIGIDMGVLELGIVRDSTLNSTNDFQVFGERFRNLAMLGPAQGALWVTQDICPTGSAAAAATALTC